MSLKDPKKRKEYLKQWHKNNPDYDKLYRKANLEKSKIEAKIYRDTHKQEKIIYREKNRDKIRKQTTAYMRKYLRKRLKNDPLFKFVFQLRSRIGIALKGKHKGSSSVELLGTSIENVLRYLESKFLPGMNWNNHGLHGWHIDHIRPCASFDLSDPTQQKICFHYTNLQPLWAIDNLKKGDYFEKI